MWKHSATILLNKVSHIIIIIIIEYQEFIKG